MHKYYYASTIQTDEVTDISNVPQHIRNHFLITDKKDVFVAVTQM